MKHGFISVVICTYNRAELLRVALESLSNQTADKDTFEVIVVANNCTDHTVQVFEEFKDAIRHCRLVNESMQGLSYARNRGFKEAKGEYIAYLDDDAKASETWVKEIQQFAARKPEASVFGGPYYGFSPKPVPEWIPPDFGSDIQADKECIVDFVNGSNMIFKKEVLFAYGGFDTELGMKGNHLGFGEETELLIKLRNDGFDIWYVPSIFVWHLIKEQNFSLWYQIKNSYYQGRESMRIFGQKKHLFSHIKSFFISCVKGLYLFFKPLKMPVKRRVYYAACPIFYSLGALLKKINL